MYVRGRVIKSTGRWCTVLTDDGRQLNCSIQGKFRIKGIKTTNPVAVGDFVDVDPKDGIEGVVVSIHDRENCIVRKSVNLSKQAHIIASNVDQCLLVVTLAEPLTSTGFIDRFLITAEAYNVPVIIVFNKLDLHGKEERETLEMYRNGYKLAGYECLCVSVVTGEGMDELKEVMRDKVNMIAGHSGVGKSSIINSIQPGLDLKTGDISIFNKGQHTTTFAEMHPLDFGGFITDTPGIKGFGLIEIKPEELGHYFPEIFSQLENCRFHNCRHISEPGCAIPDAVRDGKVASFRYTNYQNIYHDLSEDQTYRIDPFK